MEKQPIFLLESFDYLARVSFDRVSLAIFFLAKVSFTRFSLDRVSLDGICFSCWSNPRDKKSSLSMRLFFILQSKYNFVKSLQFFASFLFLLRHLRYCLTCSLQTPVKSSGNDPLSGGTAFENCCQLLPIDIFKANGLEWEKCFLLDFEKNKMLDDIDSFEQEFLEKGRTEGFRIGQIQALKDAFQLGLKNGFGISKEVAFMRQSSINMILKSERKLKPEKSDDQENDAGKSFPASKRLEKLLSEIIALADSFPLKNVIDQNLEVLIRTLRQKFKIAQALYRSFHKDEIYAESVSANSSLSF